MSIKLKPLSEQVVVITGASSGIGLVTAKRLAARGARVLLVARNEQALAATVQEIEAAGGMAAYHAADVGEAEQVEAAAAKAVSLWGRIDSWVNNAGTAIYAKLAATPLDEHQRMFRTNYFGVVNGSIAALPHLRRSGGALITVASIAADVPSPILGAYAASKHAVKGFIESLRMELVADDAPVSVTLIKPSGIDTPIAQRAAVHIEGKPQVPQPLYDPELVADVILAAAETPRRTITVGGAGRAQVLLGTHFPAILDRLARFIIPTLSLPDRPHEGQGALFHPENSRHERSGEQSGRRHSLYTAGKLHLRVLATAGVLGVAGIAAWLLLRKGDRKPVS